MPHASAVVFDFSWPVLILPAVGGLLSAAIVFFICPGAVGHGTNEMTRAFHRFQGVLGLRGPAFKAMASVLVISFGGSAGPEGPIVALGAALGSTCGRLFRVAPAQQRSLLIAGWRRAWGPFSVAPWAAPCSP